METSTHRHFVAMPIALAGLGLLVAVHTGIETTAMTASVVTDMDTQLQTEYIVQSSDYEVRESAGLRVHVFHGAASINHAAENTTVVALTAPVLVESAHATTLIPTGYQLRVTHEDTRLFRAPTSWVTSRVGSLQPLEGDSVLSSFLSTTLLHDTESLTQFRSLLSTLIDDTNLHSFGHFSLLSSTVRMTDDVALELQEMLSSSPVTRTTLPLALVQIARTERAPLPAAFFSSWPQDVVRLSTLDETLAVDALVYAVDASVRFGSEYPLQAELWKNAFRAASPTVRAIASDEQSIRISDAHARLTTASLPKGHAQAFVADLSSSAQPVTQDPAEVLRATRRMLQERHVLMSADTTVTLDAANPGSARVTGIFLEEDGQLISYAFSFDPSRDSVHSIVRGTSQTPLPNAVRSQQFFQEKRGE